MAERVFSDQLGDWKRSCYCGDVRADAVGIVVRPELFAPRQLIDDVQKAVTAATH